MKIYVATYVLSSGTKNSLVDSFSFEKEDGDWEKRDYGYSKSEGWINNRAENVVEVNNYMYHALNKKYFDKELSSEELKELEIQMRKECVIALEDKRNRLFENISRQIEFIVR